MKTKNILVLLSASFLMLALLGCVEEETVFCAADARECSDGTFVSRNPANNCEFFDCPAETGGTGSQEPQPGEQVVGPEYYDSEQEAFDALNQELDQIEDISMQELESMLGE